MGETLEAIRQEASFLVETMSPPGITFPAVVDSTMRGDFKACKHKFFEAHIRNLRGGDTNVHLHFGGCFAKGLETYRRAFYSPSSPTHRDALASIAEGASAIIRQWGDYIIPASVKKPGSLKDLEGCLDAFLSFFEKYPPDQDKVTPVMIGGEPAVEFSFALPIPGSRHPETGNPILYAGRFDMLAHYGDSAIFLNDEKTTTALGDSWLARWRLAGQFTGYTWGAQSYGYPVQGAIIRGISILSRDIGHAFVIEQRHAHQVEKFVHQLMFDVEDMVRCWNNGWWDYDFDKSCSDFGGCAYLDICRSDNEEVWRKGFHVKRWDPLGRAD